MDVQTTSTSNPNAHLPVQCQLGQIMSSMASKACQGPADSVGPHLKLVSYSTTSMPTIGHCPVANHMGGYRPLTTFEFIFIYKLFYVAFNSQGHIATGSSQVEETSAYCTVNHQASASNYQLSNMKRPARDLNRRPKRLEVRTL